MTIKGYLEKHGNQFRVQVWVPLHLQSLYGKKTIKVPLHTNSKTTANLMKLDVLNKLQREFREASKRVPASPVDNLTEEAMRWREDLNSENPQTGYYTDQGTGEEEEYDEYFVPSLLRERAEEIAKEKGQNTASNFYKVAIGEATPMMSLLPRWLPETPIKDRQHTDYKRAVKKFADWCKSTSAGSIEAVTRKLAGRYISEELVPKTNSVKTANKDISCLSSYWRWLMKRGHADSNPWEKQSLSKKLQPKSGKRAFSEEEMIKLMTGTKDTFLLDLMSVAALTGMRREEILSLTVADCSGDQFNIRKAKTDAGVRLVPTHPDLKAIVIRRCEGRAGDKFLFEEADAKGSVSGERGDFAGKRFGYYRKKIGVDDQPEGQRQSNIDFHSFRRWFIRKARNALQRGATGYDQWTIAAVVGHDASAPDAELQMTMGTYAGPQTKEAKVACVGAVKLPV